MSAYTDLHTTANEDRVIYRKAYEEGQVAKAVEVVAFIDERLAGIMSRPHMHSLLDAIEYQIMALLDVRDAALGRPQNALDEFRTFVAKRVRKGEASLYDRLREQYDDDAEARGIRPETLDGEFKQEFIAILGGFVLHYRSLVDAR